MGTTNGVKFQKGNTLAKDNNNQARKRIKKSKLRKTLEKLYELEPQSLENIKKSVNGEEIDKSVVDTSKWVVNSLMTVSKAATQEEVEMNQLRWNADKMTEEDEAAEKEEEPKVKFSLHCLPTKKELE